MLLTAALMSDSIVYLTGTSATCFLFLLFYIFTLHMIRPEMIWKNDLAPVSVELII